MATGQKGESMAKEKRTFLSAHWRHLVMVNYRIDPEILRPYVPNGVSLDFEGGETFASLVGFHFGDTRLLGLPVPFHRNFEEFNLRFYVKRELDEETRRGVTFIKEIVPRRAIAMVANLAYNERYIARPMAHHDTIGPQGGQVKYNWQISDRWNHIRADVTGRPEALEEGSHEQFIAEHYWGYTAQKDGSTVEYKVTHPSWRVWQAEDVDIDCDVSSLYGEEFVAPLSADPVSAIVAEGSEVRVSRPSRFKGTDPT